ncbi:hypothetical protein TNCV_3968451 [Trichonephila clavipes]|nr:hypothetical protein TNCV_3968451 [Trichonephila clavipes]
MWAVGSLVFRASDSRPEGMGSMPNATKYPPRKTWSTCSLNQWVRKSCGLNHECRGLENIFLHFSSMPRLCRWCHHLSYLRGIFQANSFCHLYGAQDQGQRLVYF